MNAFASGGITTSAGPAIDSIGHLARSRRRTSAGCRGLVTLLGAGRWPGGILRGAHRGRGGDCLVSTPLRCAAATSRRRRNVDRPRGRPPARDISTPVALAPLSVAAALVLTVRADGGSRAHFSSRPCRGSWRPGFRRSIAAPVARDVCRAGIALIVRGLKITRLISRTLIDVPECFAGRAPESFDRLAALDKAVHSRAASRSRRRCPRAAVPNSGSCSPLRG